jgi:hypothetical protein
MIKTLLALLGILFIPCILAGGFLYERWKSLDKTSYEYAMDAASFVFANWDFQELKRRADRQMFANNTEEGIKNVFAVMSQLGALQSVPACEGQAAVIVSNEVAINAKYACHMTFQKDAVTVTLILVGNPKSVLLGDNNNTWKIFALTTSSDYLVKSANKP